MYVTRPVFHRNELTLNPIVPRTDLASYGVLTAECKLFILSVCSPNILTSVPYACRYRHSRHADMGIVGQGADNNANISHLASGEFLAPRWMLSDS